MLSIAINTNYLKSWNGILKMLQLVLGAICIGIIENCYNSSPLSLCIKECYFLVATSSFFIGTFIFLISYLFSSFTASILPKTIHERLYNIFASILLFAASLSLILEIHKSDIKFNNYKALLAASICGLINTVLYIFNTIITYMTKWIQ